MGGGYYDRDVYHSSSASAKRSSGTAGGPGYSGEADKALGANQNLHKNLNP